MHQSGVAYGRGRGLANHAENDMLRPPLGSNTLQHSGIVQGQPNQVFDLGVRRRMPSNGGGMLLSREVPPPPQKGTARRPAEGSPHVKEDRLDRLDHWDQSVDRLRISMEMVISVRRVVDAGFRPIRSATGDESGCSRVCRARPALCCWTRRWRRLAFGQNRYRSASAW